MNDILNLQISHLRAAALVTSRGVLKMLMLLANSFLWFLTIFNYVLKLWPLNDLYLKVGA